MAVFPFTKVLALVRAMSLTAWADFTVGQKYTLSVLCGETGYYVSLEISIIGAIKK